MPEGNIHLYFDALFKIRISGLLDIYTEFKDGMITGKFTTQSEITYGKDLESRYNMKIALDDGNSQENGHERAAEQHYRFGPRFHG